MAPYFREFVIVQIIAVAIFNVEGIPINMLNQQQQHHGNSPGSQYAGRSPEQEFGFLAAPKVLKTDLPPPQHHNNHQEEQDFNRGNNFVMSSPPMMARHDADAENRDPERFPLRDGGHQHRGQNSIRKGKFGSDAHPPGSRNKNRRGPPPPKFDSSPQQHSLPPRAQHHPKSSQGRQQDSFYPSQDNSIHRHDSNGPAHNHEPHGDHICINGVCKPLPEQQQQQQDRENPAGSSRFGPPRNKELSHIHMPILRTDPQQQRQQFQRDAAQASPHLQYPYKQVENPGNPMDLQSLKLDEHHHPSNLDHIKNPFLHAPYEPQANGTHKHQEFIFIPPTPGPFDLLVIEYDYSEAVDTFETKLETED